MGEPSGPSLCPISFPQLPSNSPITRSETGKAFRNENNCKTYAELLANRNENNCKAYAELLAKHATDVPMERRQAVKRFGRLHVSFSEEEVNKSMEPLKQTLIAKFNRNRPSVDDVKKEISKSWGLDHDVSIGVIDPNHLVLQFNGEGDYLKAWLRESYVVNEILFKVFPWSLMFTPKEESPLQPVWVNLNLLPLNLFNTDFLASIVSGLGKFLAVDHATKWRTRPSRARVCVEMDLMGEFPKEITIEMGLEKFV